MQEVTIQQLTDQDGLFCDGDWIESKDQAKDGDIRLIQLADIGDGCFKNKSARFLYKSTAERLNCTYLQQGDILIARMPDPLGRACIFPLDGEAKYVTAVDVAILRLSCDVVDNRYVCYMLNSPQIRQKIMELQSGTTRKRISRKNLATIELPLPKIEIQKQIVIRIEELLSELDKGVSELNRIQKQFEIYRQTVLYEAFMGNLSVDLREKKQSNIMLDYAEPAILTNGFITIPELPDGWAWVSIGDISNGVQYGSSQKSNKNGQVPVLRMGNIQNCRFDWSDLVYSSDEIEINKYQLRKGDVLFNRTNSPELVGKTAIYKGEQPAIFAGYLIRLNQKDFINPNYLNYYLNSPIAKRCGNLLKTDGVNQSNINGKKLCQYPFPLCTLDEQEYIVDLIESKFSICDKIEQTVNQSLQKAETLRQSILKLAFEGKLV